MEQLGHKNCSCIIQNSAVLQNNSVNAGLHYKFHEV